MREYEHIGSFEQAIKWWQTRSEFNRDQLTELSEKIWFRGTIKLHGSNCAVIVHPDDTIETQSRTRIITPDDDFKGFSKFIHDRDRTKFFQARASDTRKCARDIVTFYGEWVGPGVMGGTACAQLPSRQFVVFSTHVSSQGFIYHPFTRKDHSISKTKTVRDDTEKMGIFCSLSMNSLIINHKKWEHIYEIFVDMNDEASIAAARSKVLELTDSVEKQCPWAAQFDVIGTGEGIVWEPISQGHFGIPELKFKSKGKLHAVVAEKPEKPHDQDLEDRITGFVAYAVTTNRLSQGIEAMREKGLSIDMRTMGEYLKWLSLDIQRECAAELLEFDLTWKAAHPAVQTAARDFFKSYVLNL